jgi:hypothetical protein
MDTAILTHKNANLTPEARWLVMQWASIIGLDQSVDCPLQTLFARLGLTYAQGRRAWDVLTGKQGENQERFVEIERLPSKGPGRPASRYRLSAMLVKALAATPAPACEHHAEEIATLAKTTRLSTADKKTDLMERGRRRRTGLMLPNRWLLMVLLAHADSQGIVTRLSVSAMHRLTGMSRYRITSQLKKLVDLGLIAHYQPGRYSPQASARKTSIYLLDLAHPLLGKRLRVPIIMVSPPSSTKPKKTELVGGIIDAVMTVGVCNLQIDTVLKEYNAIKAAESNTSNDARGKTSEGGLDGMAEAYQAKYDQIKYVMDSALALMPIMRYPRDGIEELLNNYDEKDTDWLLTSVHIDAGRLLSSAWSELKKGQLGHDQPCHDIIIGTARRLGLVPEYMVEENPEDEAEVVTEEGPDCSHNEDDEKSHRPTEAAPTAKQISYPPLALLFYALSHHLAERLQDYFKPDDDIDFEAMTYVLVPVYPEKTDKHHPPAYQIRGYGLKIEDNKDKQKTILFQGYVGEDLKTYWRTHHQDCLSASSDEPNDSTPDSPEPADQ